MDNEWLKLIMIELYSHLRAPSECHRLFNLLFGSKQEILRLQILGAKIMSKLPSTSFPSLQFSELQNVKKKNAKSLRLQTTEAQSKITEPTVKSNAASSLLKIHACCMPIHLHHAESGPKSTSPQVLKSPDPVAQFSLVHVVNCTWVLQDVCLLWSATAKLMTLDYFQTLENSFKHQSVQIPSNCNHAAEHLLHHNGCLNLLKRHNKLKTQKHASSTCRSYKWCWINMQQATSKNIAAHFAFSWLCNVLLYVLLCFTICSYMTSAHFPTRKGASVKWPSSMIRSKSSPPEQSSITK